MMKRSQIAAQLYCFRAFIQTERGIADTFRRLHDSGYEAVQLTAALPASLTPEKLLKLLADHGLKAVSSHESSIAIINETARIVEKLQALGIKHLAYAAPHVSPTGIGEVIDLAEKLNTAAEEFKRNGITLAYHNHALEFHRFEGELMLDLIYKHAPALQGEIDTHWVQRGGGNPVTWIKKLNNRMDVIHLKDYGIETPDVTKIWSYSPVMKPVGYGSLEWDEIIPAAEKCGVKVFVVEHDGDVLDPFDSFARSFAFLAQNFCK